LRELPERSQPGMYPGVPCQCVLAGSGMGRPNQTAPGPIGCKYAPEQRGLDGRCYGGDSNWAKVMKGAISKNLPLHPEAYAR
jgi:hypothetical protein